jgi:hypothetical protein
MAGSYGHGNATLGSIKGREYQGTHSQVGLCSIVSYYSLTWLKQVGYIFQLWITTHLSISH